MSEQTNETEQKPKKEKLTRAERKARLKQQQALEKKLVEAGKISPRVKYVPRSFLWNVLSLCLAFFFGIFVALGALLGFGAYAGTKMSVKDVLGMVGVEYTDYVNEEYANMSMLDLIDDVSKTEFSSLQSIGKYTPFLEKELDKANEQLAVLGVHVNVKELMGVSFSEIGTYMKENVVQNIVLGETLGLTPEDDQLMISLCYGVEGEDYTVSEDGKFVMAEGKSPTTVGMLTDDASSLLKRVQIEAILGVKADSAPAMRYLAYGTEGEQYKIENGEVVMLTNEATGEPFAKRTVGDLTAENTDVLGDAKIGDFIDTKSATGLMAAIKDWKINDLTSGYRIERLKIGQILQIDESSSLLMQAMKDWRVKDFTDPAMINSLTLGEVIEVDETSPRILASLKDTRLGDFGEKMDTLRLNDILDPAELEGNKLLRNLAGSTLPSLASDVQNLTVRDIYGEELYSYMPGAKGAYTQLYDNYAKGEHPYKDDETNSAIRPAPIPQGTEVTEKRTVTADSSIEVREGYFVKHGTSFVPVDTADVYTERTETGGVATVSRYVLTRKTVEKNYVWKLVDYEASGTKDLGEDSVGTDTMGYTDGTVPCDDPAVTENGSPLYYLEAGGKYYPLCEDGYGVYFLRRTESGSTERFDLEREIASYVYTESGETCNLDGDGKLVLGEQAYTVYTQAATETEPAYDYIRIKEEAVFGYSENTAATEYTTLYEESDTTVRYYASWTDGSTTHTNEEVDRYFEGVWHLLLGRNEDGTLADHSDTPVLELNTLVSQTTGKINDLTLWEMYFHRFLSVNPYVALPTGGNLNDMTVSQVIAYVKTLP